VIGHVGSRVSALVDGQLSSVESERLWSHVHGCPLCRGQVEREGWVKTRLAGLTHAPAPAAPPHLYGSLASVTSQPSVGWPSAGPTPPARSRAVMVAALGAGSLGAALVGVLGVASPADTPGSDRRLPVTSLTRPSQAPVTTVTTGPVAPAAPAASGALAPRVATPQPRWVRIEP